MDRVCQAAGPLSRAVASIGVAFLLAAGPARAEESPLQVASPGSSAPAAPDVAAEAEAAKPVPEPPELPEPEPEPEPEPDPEPESEPEPEPESGTPADPESEAGREDDAEAAEETVEGDGVVPPGEQAVVVEQGPSRWKPPLPEEDGWDWIRFDTGEWLKGEIKILRDDDLEFESDKLGDLTLDFDDVDRLQTTRIRTFVLYDDSTITGTAIMVGDEVAVGAGDETVRFKRQLLRKIIPGRDRELDYWFIRGSAGLGLRSGNTDETELTGKLLIRRDSVRNRFTIDYAGAYGVIDDSKNTNNHRGNAILDSLITRHFYWNPASFSVFSDEFQNISYRLTPSVGVGYYVIRNAETDAGFRVGAGYQYTRFDEVQPQRSNDADTAVFIFEPGIETEITSAVDLIARYRLQLGVPDVDETNHHTEATLEIEITSHIDIDISLVWDRNESPAQDADGEAPEKDDVRTTVGVAFEF